LQNRSFGDDIVITTRSAQPRVWSTPGEELAAPANELRLIG
jgi:hypothetical protein